MSLKRQTQVMVELDKMAGKRLGQAAGKYRRKVISPLLAAIREAGSPEAALGNLGGDLLRRMGSGGLEEAVAETEVQAALIGRTAAMPVRMRNAEG